MNWRERKNPEAYEKSMMYSNWRDKSGFRSAKPVSVPDISTSFVSNYNGNDIKYCPGNRCRMFLPLFQFAHNNNMPDGRDTYCLECNFNKRKEKEEKRRKSRNGIFYESIDKFAAFQKEQERLHGTYYTRSGAIVLKRDIIEKIQGSLDEAQEKGIQCPFTANTIFDKLFTGRRFLCEITGHAISPTCFMDHHAVKIVYCDGRIDVKCNKCIPPS